MVKRISITKLTLYTVIVGVLFILFLGVMLSINDIKEIKSQQVISIKTKLIQSTGPYYSDIVNMAVGNEVNRLSQFLYEVKNKEALFEVKLITDPDQYNKLINDCVISQYDDNSLHQIPSCFVIKGGYIRTLQEIRSGGLIVGYLLKVKQIEFSSKELISSYLKNAFLIFLCGVLFSFLLVLQFKRHLVRPLKCLSEDTEKVLAEEQINEYKIKELHVLAKALMKTYKKLEQNSKLAAIGETTAMLAHDVRKPFTLLKIVLNRFETFKTSPDGLDKAKADIEKAISNVEAMLNDVMDFSREVKLEVQPCSLDTILEFAGRTAQTHQHSDVKFVFELKNAYKPLVDDERMSRVFINIITNAMDAMSCGDGNIYMSSKDTVKDEESFVEVIIANTGPQFTEDDLTNLFSPAFTKGKKGGTGLGLASARKIVCLHGGTIVARNMDLGMAADLGLRENEGVEFVINIPASADDYDTTRRLNMLPKDAKKA